MENLSNMIDAARTQNRDEFLDSFAHEVINRINEKISVIHKSVSKNLLQQEGVWKEPEIEEIEEVEESAEVNETVLRHAIPTITFETIEEAKIARKQMMKKGMCESCITQRGEKLHLNVEDIHEDAWGDIYFIVKEISEDTMYDPYHEFAYFIKEALEDGQVEFELADGSVAVINSEMAQQISRVHDMLSGKNQQIFRDNMTLSEESFEQMMNFVEDAMENLDEDNTNSDRFDDRQRILAQRRADRVNAARRAGKQPSAGDLMYSDDPAHRAEIDKSSIGGKG